MSTDPELLARLGSVPLYAGLDDSERSDIAIGTRLLRFARGDVLMRQGAKPDGIYFIVGGRVQVTTKLPGGGETLVAELGPGSTLGELALIRTMPRTATVTAAEPVEAVYADWRFLEAALGQLRPGAFKVVQQLAVVLAGRLRLLHERIGQSATGTDRFYETLRLPPPAETSADMPRGFDVGAFLPVLPCFRDFDPASLAAVRDRATVLAVQRGDRLAAVGEPPGQAWIVVRGAVASGFSESGRMHLVNVRGPGSFCATGPLIENRPASVDYVVCENVVLLVLPRHEFRQLFLSMERNGRDFLTAIIEHQAAMVARATNHAKRLVGLSRLYEQLRSASGMSIVTDIT